MITGLVLLGVFFLLVMLDVPIAFSIGLATLAALLTALPFDPAVTVAAQRLAGGLDSFTLLAIPLFVISGYLMGQGGIARRLIDAAKAVIGAVPGGLALVNILSCMLFGSISGSAVAATSAIGTFMIPVMEKDGYDRNYSTAVTVTGSILGLLIPPSNVLIVYAVAAGGVSIAALFLGGYLPGIIAGLALMVAAALYAKRKGYPAPERLSLRESGKALLAAGPSALMILIVVGGIIAGVFTATEASAIAVLYALILSVIVYREIAVKDLPALLLKAVETSAMVLLLIGVSTGMAWVLAFANIPQAVADALLSISDNPIIILLLINIILL
ncbi:MAG: TRAP transporter large permease, partial [Robiginitomaculum sp.]